MDIDFADFRSGEEIPEKHGYMGDNTNPKLLIENPPENAETLALIVDDPDAVEPAGKVWVHWIAWNIPSTKQVIEEGESLGNEGITDFRQKGYNGPNPPDGKHTYVFRLYALDKKLSIPEDSKREKLDDAMQGHILEKAQVKADFKP